ncbi:MAG: hypothetical protein ACTSVI_07065 [Promethearchaeota archaeon]
MFGKKIHEVMVFLTIFLLNSICFTLNCKSTSANGIDIIDSNNEGIYANEIQYFAIYNDVRNTSMTIRLLSREYNGAAFPYPDLDLAIFSWDAYKPGLPSNESLFFNRTSNYINEASFSCNYHQRYLVRIINMDNSSNSTYNMTVETEVGVPINDDVFFQEQGYVPNVINIGYYFTTDPWLYDSMSTEDRLVIAVGDDVYGPLSYVRSYGERYFQIKNLYENVKMFIGITVYSDEPPSSHSLALYDWAYLDRGVTTALKVHYTLGNYSCGFNFTCVKGHTYQLWFYNGDPYYGVFLNVTFYTWGKARVRFDNDLEPEPPDDQIRVRIYGYNPWLEYRRDMRTIYYWIFGGGGIGVGVVVAFIWIRRRLS